MRPSVVLFNILQKRYLINGFIVYIFFFKTLFRTFLNIISNQLCCHYHLTCSRFPFEVGTEVTKLEVSSLLWSVMFVPVFMKVRGLVQKVHVMTHKLHCDVVMPTVLYFGRNVDEMKMLGLTCNTEFHENAWIDL